MSASGKRVVFVLANNFEDVEATSPIEALNAVGVTSIIVGSEKGTVTGKKGAELTVTHTFADVGVDDFDALVIAGGGSPETLRIDDHAVAFTRAFLESGKPVASICHGPQLLISAKVLAGRNVTAVNKIRDDIINAGGLYSDEELIVDGNLISSRVPGDLPVFNQAIIDSIA